MSRALSHLDENSIANLRRCIAPDVLRYVAVTERDNTAGTCQLKNRSLSPFGLRYLGRCQRCGDLSPVGR